MSSVNTAPSFCWLSPNIAPQALLLCVHGLGLHGGIYRSFGERMAKLGVATFAFDVRGFGHWNKYQLSKLDLSACIGDIKEKIWQLKQEYMNLPIFILGESMGGAIATKFAAEHEKLLDGLILCAPARTILEHKLEMLKVFMQTLCAPHKLIVLSPHVIGQTPLMLAGTEPEAKIRLHFSVGELAHMSELLLATNRNATNIKNIPVLVVQGYSDQAVTARSTLQFFHRLSTPNKDLVILGNTEHLIFQKQEVNAKAIQLANNWIKDRLLLAPFRQAS